MKPDESVFPTQQAIKEAALRIKPYVRRTPVFTSQSLNSLVGADLYFKCENLQRGGAFKFRGACNAIFSLDDETAKRGVATHSSGNHAQALTLAARLRNIKAYVVMPKTAPMAKKNAVKAYGAEITFCEPTAQAREEALKEVVKKTGAHVVHSFNDYRIITGQATAAMEFIEEIKDLDFLLAPVGGGGLLSGTLLSAFYFSPSTQVYGAEPKGADDAFRSLKENKILPSVNPKTIADGLLMGLGDKTFPIIKSKVKEIVTVSEEAIIRAMWLIWERMKIIVEPSGCVPFAALLEGGIPVEDRKIGLILSGGNVDLGNLPWTDKKSE